MRRVRKPSILAIACALAFLLARRPGSDLRDIGGVSPSARAGAYDLDQLSILTRTLFQVNELYYDKTRFDQRRMLLGALDGLERAVPELLVEHLPERQPRQVRVRVASDQRLFDISAVDSPWSLRRALQQIVGFVQPRLPPLSGPEAVERVIAIEVAIANGVLATLDPHSAVLDVETYRELRTHTQGRFGGVGMSLVEDPRGGILVRKVVPDAPAVRAGILPGDRIVRIDNESTINMTSLEAVDRLRGQVGERVDVYIERRGSPSARKLTLVRSTIQPSSIADERVLTSPAAGVKIGYLRIDSFSATTEADMLTTLARLQRHNVKGLILDLRDNPGGLYEQAFKVADRFIDAGTLVSMVGVNGSQRRDEVASTGGNTKLPLALLVDGQTASAAEIVAAAVKNLDRGVLIGDTTFGKGSVQTLFDLPLPSGGRPRARDDARLGLKLTTAQYLTPGDLSIQGVGVSPDVQLVPMRVDFAGDGPFIHLQSSAHRRQEADLESTLPHAGARTARPPAEVIAYLQPPPPLPRDPGPTEPDGEEPRADDEPTLDEPGDAPADFAMELARDLLAQARSLNRRQLVAGSQAFFERVRASQDDKLRSAVEKLGVDWSAGPARAAGPPAVLHATLSLVDRAPVQAGDRARLRGVIENASRTTAHRVRLLLDSGNRLFDENELLFGRIGPHERRAFDLPLKVPLSSLTRTDLIRGQVRAQTPVEANVPELTIELRGKPRPLFAYTHRTVEAAGNGDGRIQPGEKVRLLVTVRNVGAGPSLRTEATLRNGPGQPGILITAGRFRLDRLPPGASRDLVFEYQLGERVGSDLGGDRYQLELTVADTVLHESVTDQIEVRLAGPSNVATEVTPPVLTVTAPAVAEGPTVRVMGEARDRHHIRDLYIQVYNADIRRPAKKVYYLSNPRPTDALTFDAAIPVHPGSNVVQVVARETERVTSIVNAVVLCKPPTPSKPASPLVQAP